jgi:hypothetical protein
MSDFLHLNNIYLIFLFFFPGFISLKVYDLLVPNEKRNFSHDFLEAVSYSILNLSLLVFLLAPAIYFKWYENIWIFCVIALFTLLVFPVIWPILFHWICAKNFFSKWFVSPIKRPWDWVFARLEPSWVIVHLHDGRKIGGIWDRKSYASSFPVKEQIYLEKVWKLDEQGGFENPIESSKGIILLGEDVSSVEFFENK